MARLWDARRALGLIEEAESELGPELERAVRPPMSRRRGFDVGEGSSAHQAKVRYVQLDALERRRLGERLKALVGEECLCGGVELDSGSRQAPQELSLRRAPDLDLPNDWHCSVFWQLGGGVTIDGDQAAVGRGLRGDRGVGRPRRGAPEAWGSRSGGASVVPGGARLSRTDFIAS